jgi:hypothetical protein
VGVLCIEFFVLADGTLVVNEMAPRPHNSGHYTMDACVTSQFAQQVRAMARLPLGEVRQHSPAVMLNILGDIWFEAAPRWRAEPAWDQVLALPGACLHLYGKEEARRGRKMGHVTFVAPTLPKRRTSCTPPAPSCVSRPSMDAPPDAAAIARPRACSSRARWWPCRPRPCTAWAPTPKTRPRWRASTPPRAARKTTR